MTIKFIITVIIHISEKWKVNFVILSLSIYAEVVDQCGCRQCRQARGNLKFFSAKLVKLDPIQFPDNFLLPIPVILLVELENSIIIELS